MVIFICGLLSCIKVYTGRNKSGCVVFKMFGISLFSLTQPCFIFRMKICKYIIPVCNTVFQYLMQNTLTIHMYNIYKIKMKYIFKTNFLQDI